MDLIDVYAAAQDSVHTYRIAALAVTRQGTLLAFAEARQRGAGDAGDIDLVVRRSTDGGDSWGETDHGVERRRKYLRQPGARSRPRQWACRVAHDVERRR